VAGSDRVIGGLPILQGFSQDAVAGRGRHDHEWYWFPQQKPTEVSMLKCYDSVTDGSVSRWSFHTACVDPTAPRNARCRKNVVVRSFVFF
jgi:hypothetical protein